MAEPDPALSRLDEIEAAGDECALMGDPEEWWLDPRARHTAQVAKPPSDDDQSLPTAGDMGLW